MGGSMNHLIITIQFAHLDGFWHVQHSFPQSPICDHIYEKKALCEWGCKGFLWIRGHCQRNLYDITRTGAED